jgi:hypothetical protein
MKKVVTGVSFFILTLIFTTQASAQLLSSAKEITPSKNKVESNVNRGNSAVNMAAIVFTSSDDKEKIRIHFENYVKGKVTIKLSYLGSVIHKEISEEDLYRRKFDMQNLPLGEYAIEIANGNQVYAKKVSIKSENGVRVLSII